MADLLTRIAQQALGTAPTVLPALHPVFAETHAAAEVADVSEGAVERAPRPALALEQRAAEQPHQPDLYRAHRSVRGAVQDERQARPVPELAVAREGEFAHTMPPDADESQAVAALLPARPTLRQVVDQLFPLEAEAEVIPRRSEIRGMPIEEPAIPKADVAAWRIPRVSQQEPNARADGPRERGNVRAAGDADSSVGQAFLQERSQPQPTIQHAPLQRVERAEARPVPGIQVTIGSIELKAAQAAPPATGVRGDARPAHMSLNQYLEQRKSGLL